MHDVKWIFSGSEFINSTRLGNWRNKFINYTERNSSAIITGIDIISLNRRQICENRSQLFLILSFFAVLWENPNLNVLIENHSQSCRKFEWNFFSDFFLKVLFSQKMSKKPKIEKKWLRKIKPPNRSGVKIIFSKTLL